jgi:hypothetical protein
VLDDFGGEPAAAINGFRCRDHRAQIADVRRHVVNLTGPGNSAPAEVDEDVLSQCRGEHVPGASAIACVNPGIYHWRQLGTRSLNGVIGDASTASAEKGERLLEAIAAKVAGALRAPALWDTPI